jgi:hypothetical protein
MYERENIKLQKMIDRRTYTRVKCAFGAESSQGTITNISSSYDQGEPVTNTVKLTTKEKIQRLREMLSNLEQQVHHDANSNLDWEHSDSEEDKKPASIITSAQAKLAKELIKLTNTYKVPELTFTDKAM